MQKMRRLFAALAAFFVMVLCVVPAAAADDSVQICYAPLQFDIFSGSLSDQSFPWMFNEFQPATNSEFSFDNGAVTGTYSLGLSDDAASCFFRFPMVAGDIGSTEVLTLKKAGEQFLSVNWLDSYVMLPSESDFDVLRVEISANLGIPGKRGSGAGSNEVYSYSYIPLQSTFIPDPETNVCYLGKWLHDLLNLHVQQRDYTYAYLNDLEIKIFISRNDVSTPGFLFAFKPNPNFPNFAFQWLAERKLPLTYTAAPDSFTFDWLVRSVDAFMTFELVPGFSLNAIFEVILAIGVVLWFIKLIH